jgi:hypothetical protein
MRVSRQAVDSPPSASGVPLKAATHRCRLCQKPFAYHYDVFYDRAQLTAVDFVCRDCFGQYVLQEEARRARAADLAPCV